MRHARKRDTHAFTLTSPVLKQEPGVSVAAHPASQVDSQKQQTNEAFYDRGSPRIFRGSLD